MIHDLTGRRVKRLVVVGFHSNSNLTAAHVPSTDPKSWSELEYEQVFENQLVGTIEPFLIGDQKAGHEREKELASMKARTGNTTDFATPVNLLERVREETDSPTVPPAPRVRDVVLAISPDEGRSVQSLAARLEWGFDCPRPGFPLGAFP
jgi:hypothetical protein